jgi:hypothetical protein
MFIVANDRFHHHRNADGVELFREVKRVCVFEARRQQFGSNCNDFRREHD